MKPPLLIFLIVLCPNGLENDFITEASKSLDALVALLNLTDLTCESVEWCTIRTNSYRPLLKGTCCPPCSCEKQCYEDGTCCPDIKLSQHLNGMVFSNTTQLLSEITEIGSQQELDVAFNNSWISQGHDGIECIRSSVLPARSKYSSNIPRYLMVATCQNRSVSAYEKDKCVKEQGNPSDIQLNDMRPVQSRQSGVVYRNIHCFKCSNEHGYITDEWDVYIVDAIMMYERILDFDQPYPDIITYVLEATNSRASTNIFFLPSTELRKNQPPKMCIKMDVEICGENKPDNYDPTKDACQMFSLPVFSEYKTNSNGFKNLACIHCSGYDTSAKTGGVCSGYAYWAMPPFLWKLRNELLRTTGPNDTNATKYADTGITIDAFSSSRCYNGFFYDKVQQICRKIYCPCGMMAYNLTCIPTYPAIPGKNYNIFFSVISTNKMGADQADLQYDEAIMTHFQHHFDNKKDVSVTDITLFKSYSEDADRDDVIHVLFSAKARSIHYENIFKTISQLTRGTQVNYIDKQFVVDISVVEIIHSTRDILLPKRQKKYIFANATTMAYFDMFPHDTITIKSCQFCYLVEVLQDELEIKAGTYYLPRTKKTGSLTSVLSMKGTDRWFICANEVFEQLKEIVNTNPLETGCCTGIADDTENDVYKSTQTVPDRNAVILCTSLVAIALLISLMVARRLKTNKERTDSLDANPNNADALEMSNINPE